MLRDPVQAEGLISEALNRVEESLGARARRDAPLGARTTYRVGGSADLLVEADQREDLLAVAEALNGVEIPILVVGVGSNLLISDGGFRGLAVVLGDGMATLEIDTERASVTAGAALKLPLLARRVVAAGLTGLEWAVGVPGSVGGAVRMNAGGHGSDVAASLSRAEVLSLVTGDIRSVGSADLEFGYRSSSLDSTEVVLTATFDLEPGDRALGEAELAEIVQWRRANQPGGQNAGSVFVNPPAEVSDRSSGELIDGLGLKGRRLGTASVSAKHANFIQADEAGSADDVHRLIHEVAAEVCAETGVRLHTEIRMIGFGDGSGSTTSASEASQ